MNNSYRILTNWKREQSGQDCVSTDGVSFGTDGVTTPGTGTGDGARRGPRCWGCSRYGHVRLYFPGIEGIDDTAAAASSKAATHGTSTRATTNTQEKTEETQAGGESGEQLLINAAADGEFGEEAQYMFLSDGNEVNRSVTLNVGSSVIPSKWILLDN